MLCTSFANGEAFCAADLWTVLFVCGTLVVDSSAYLIVHLSKGGDMRVIETGHSVRGLCSWRDLLCSLDNTSVRVWNSDLQCVANLSEGMVVYCMTVWNGKLCLGCMDRSIRIYDEKERCTATLSIPSRAFVNCLCVWNNMLCAGYRDSVIRLWKDEETDYCRELCGHNGDIFCFQTWKDLLCSGSSDNSIRVWNQQFECLHVLKGHKWKISSLAVWRDFLFSSSYDKTIRVWDMSDEGRCIQVLWGFVMPMSPLCIWKQHFLCSGSFAGVICQWNLVPLSWSPSTHYTFPKQEKKIVLCIMQLSLKKETKGNASLAHWHPESPFHQLDKDILFRILSFAITLPMQQEDHREQEAIQSYRSLVTTKMNSSPQIIEIHNSEPEINCTLI